MTVAASPEATSRLAARPLTAAAFAPFGEVIETAGDPSVMINAGRCARFSDLARFDIAEGRLGLSLFASELCAPPYRCDLLERHPLGSQCFVPMGGSRYLVVVAADAEGRPEAPQAFLAAPHQAVNLARNVWHGVLAPLDGTGLFAVLDRNGPGPNLEEHRLDPALSIALPETGPSAASPGTA